MDNEVDRSSCYATTAWKTQSIRSHSPKQGLFHFYGWIITLLKKTFEAMERSKRLMRPMCE